MGRRIAIIGNADGAARAAALEADFVIRFNNCRSAGPDAINTDVVAVCNTGRPARAMLDDESWKDSEAVAAAGAIWCVRAPSRYARLRREIAISHPELNDYCDDYSEGFEEFAAVTGKAFHIVPEAVHVDLEKRLFELNAVPFVSPSSGLLVLQDVLENFADDGDEVVLAGFSHTGWDGHPFEAERKLVDLLVTQGRMRRFDIREGKAA